MMEHDQPTYVMVSLDMLERIREHAVRARGAIWNEMVNGDAPDRLAVGQLEALIAEMELPLRDGYALRNQRRLRTTAGV